MTDNAVLSATFIAVGVGTMVWATIGMIVRLRRHRKATPRHTDD